MATVCVTGASGYIASHLVKVLLEKGYKVHGTVRDKTNEKKVQHLLSLSGASDRLTLFNADLMVPNSFNDALDGCTGVFHAASPFFFGSSSEEDFVPPAVEGTLNVLRSIAERPAITRVVVTSSMAAVAYDGGKFGSDHVYTDEDWSIEEYQREIKAWYALSKTLAEKAAWDFVEEQKKAGRNMELLVVNPTLVVGPILQGSVNASVELVENILKGEKKEIPNSCMSFVDVRDVADAHVLAFEKGSPGNRFVCMTAAHPWKEWYEILRAASPNNAEKIPIQMADGDAKSPMLFDNSKLTDLGWKPRDIKTSLVDTVASLE